uniref:uncharacterized protein LOC124057314 n=1 Tax=Scatophagus argus TaxID=75038 RepID=UPI001ED80DB1|nr:uncharacterized protein LOC124057314 [Scatophagus argus]
MLDTFTHEYYLCNAVIIFTQGRRRSEVEALPYCKHRNSDGDLRSTPAGSLPWNNPGIKEDSGPQREWEPFLVPHPAALHTSQGRSIMVCLMQGQTSITRAEAETTVKKKKRERGGRRRPQQAPLQAGVGRRAALATGSCEFFGEWKMSYGETYWPPTPPTRHPKMTPDPFMCLYQVMEVRNSDESLWLCVYTPESRKEGNQPRSAKSGEVRENSCSPPELQ